MIIPHPSRPSLSRCFVVVASLFVAAQLHAQVAAPIDAATLAKYDANKNGKLDPEETLAMEAAASTVQLSVFEVKTDKDVGYQAIDAGTGGRIDLPMKLSASAMSAMTKEFLDDWSITNMQDSFRYAMSVDPGSFNQNGTPFGDFQYNFRGSGDAGNYPTRNGFLNYSVADSYNTERFEFSMGPNSILFGDGQIGGLATSSTKMARLGRNFYGGSARWDSWGGWRFTADTNRVVGEKFAIRLNVLYQKDTFGSAWRDGLRSRDRGMDLAMTYAFTRDTQFSVDIEFDNKRNVSISNTYGDQTGYYTPGYTYDRLTPNALTTAQQQAGGVTPVSTNAQNWTFIPALSGYGLFNTGGSQYWRSTGPGFAIQPEGRSDLPGIATVAKLPSRHFTLGANDTWSRYKQQTYTFNLDHRFSDKVSGRVSFYDYMNDRNVKNASANSLQYDLNRFGPDGKPNPKLGVLYGEATPSRQVQDNYVYEWRGLLTYRTPLPFWHAKGQFAGVLGVRNERFELTSWTAARVDGPNILWNASENTIRYRFYADEPMKYSGNDLPKDSPGFTYRFVQSGGQGQTKGIEYAQFVSAISLWDERINLTIGTRNDAYNDEQYAAINGFNDIHGFTGYGAIVPGVGARPGARTTTKTTALTSNFGVVAWADKGQHIGGFYNYSENFSPATSGDGQITSFNADGSINVGQFSPQKGSGSEMGLKFNFFQGRVSAEARYYMNKYVDRIDGGPPVAQYRTIWTNSGPTYANNTALTGMAYRDVSSGETSGYEFKVVSNIGNVRLQANYALPRTKSGLSRPLSQAYYDKFLPAWTKWAAELKNDKGEAITAAEATNISNQILSIQSNFASVVPGTTNNTTYKHTGSLAGTYQFPRESKLRGVSAGYGISVRGERKVGSVSPLIKFGLTQVGARAATPAETAAAAFDYIYQPAYYTQDINIAYRKRFGKYNFRFQLNVNNFTDNSDLVFGNLTTYRVLGLTSNPLETRMFQSGFNYLEPRKFILTTSVDF